LDWPPSFGMDDLNYFCYPQLAYVVVTSPRSKFFDMGQVGSVIFGLCLCLEIFPKKSQIFVLFGSKKNLIGAVKKYQYLIYCSSNVCSDQAGSGPISYYVLRLSNNFVFCFFVKNGMFSSCAPSPRLLGNSGSKIGKKNPDRI